MAGGSDDCVGGTNRQDLTQICPGKVLPSAHDPHRHCMLPCRAAGSSEATHSGATARGEVAQQASQRPASRLQREGPAAQPAGAAAAAGPATGGTVGVGDAPPLIQLSPFDKPVPAAAAAGTAAAYNDLDWDDDTPMFLDSCK